MRTDEQRKEHTGSYYAATVRQPTDYPALQGSVSADVCVVGAGFTGISTALTLAERGYSVVVVEANRVGWGASGRNGGQIINGMRGLDKLRKQHGPGIDDIIWNLRWRGNDIIYDRVERYGIDCDIKSGFAEVALKPRQLPWLEEYAEDRSGRDFPYQYEVWDRAKTQEMLGSEAYIGAFVCYRDGHVHPLNLCIGEARAAVSLGVKIFEQSPVTKIDHGDRPVVHTEHGQVEANAVVLAGNAYGRFEPKHLSGLIFPASSYIIATEPLSEELVESVNPGDVAVTDMNEIVDYHRLSGDKRMLYGGACNYSGREPRSIREFIQPRMLQRYPQLKDLKIEFEWGGKIGIVLNRVPTLGRINGNVYYCQGYSGHGVAATHVMGEVMADAVSGTLERFDLFSQVKHFKIPGSQWFGNQMIALGMLWYRMKDLK